ncbi:MAG: hypothetical protein IJU54_02935 [Alphaproteobacteria bacterium]|nr:hypothetical protein [Alphaproteobacteria bacterium]
MNRILLVSTLIITLGSTIGYSKQTNNVQQHNLNYSVQMPQINEKMQEDTQLIKSQIVQNNNIMPTSQILKNNEKQVDINNNQAINNIAQSNTNITNSNSNIQTQDTKILSNSMQLPQLNTPFEQIQQTNPISQSQTISTITSNEELNASNINNNANVIRNDINNTNIIKTESINNTNLNTDTNSRSNFVIDGNDLLEKLQACDAEAMFNNAIDVRKRSNNSLIVSFELTKEICESIRNKDIATLKNIILTNDKKYDVYSKTFEDKISNMINNFNRQEDLDHIIKYLNITGNNAEYKPVSSMKNWLMSLPKETFKAIEDVAKPFLEEKSEDKILQSFTLLANFYFNTGNNSEIDIPSKQEFALINELKKKEIAINEQVNKVKNEVKDSGTTLEAIKLFTEIEDLKKNTSLTELAEVEKNIKEVNEKINTATKNKEKAIDEYNKTSKGKKEQLEKELKILEDKNTELETKLTRIPDNLSNKRVRVSIENNINTNKQDIQKKQEELTKIANAEEITKKYDDELNELNTEASKLNDTKIELEKKCKPINKSITEKEEALKKHPMLSENQLPYIRGLIEKCNKSISKILSEAKEIFNTDWVNKETINKMNQ